MQSKQIVRLVASVTSGILMAIQTASAQVVEPDEHGFMIASPEAMIPAEGSRRVLLYGDPSQPGLYAIRITFPPGSGSEPHYHSTARYITVIKGTWWVSSGPEADIYDPDHMKPVTAGTFIYQPPEGHHYDMAKDEEVTVQIMGMGPVVTTSIPQPADTIR